MSRKYLIPILLVLFLPSVALAAVPAGGFNRNLYYGMRNNPDVVTLQDFLRRLNFFAPPQSTGNFFMVTVDAVKKFQRANNITPVSGFFGWRSRTAANKILASENTATMGSTGSTATIPAGQDSLYKGKIVIGYASGGGALPENEFIYIENRSEGDNISITGMELSSTKGVSFTIPRAYFLPGMLNSGADDSVVLKPNGRAILTAGRQERKINFQTNLCTGYFNETSKFIPKPANRCPQVASGDLPDNLSDNCVQIIQNTGACRAPQTEEPIYEERCSQYIASHLNYNGCVADYRARTNFYSGEWLIWMQRSAGFLRATRETLILKDTSGKEVDRYSY